MLLTYFVAERTKLSERIWILAQFFAVLEADRVDHKMRMSVVGVAVCGNKNLVARPSLCGKFKSYLMCLLRSDVFLRRKGLDVLIEIDAGGLVISIFGDKKFVESIFAVTVHAGDQSSSVLVCNLLLLTAVVDQAFHSADGLL